MKVNSAQRVVLLLLAVSLLAGFIGGSPIYFRLSLLWGLLFFGGWLWSSLSLRGIGFERTARALRAQVGQVFEERFEVSNDSPLFRFWLEVRNESTLPGSSGSHVLTMIGGRQKRIYWAQTLLTQRGVFSLGPTILASGDLFGLFPRTRLLPAEDSLLVYPLMVDIQSFPNPPGLLPGGEALRRRTHQVTPNAAGVREYFPGDPLNRIHWMSTARRNRLMAKEFELDPLAEVWIFLDAARYVHARLPTPPQPTFIDYQFWKTQAKVSLPPSTEEYMVSVAASLARYYLRRSRAVGLIASGGHLTLLPPDRGGRQLGKTLEALSLLKADGDLPLRGLVEAQAKHLPRGSTVVIITPSVMQEVAYDVEYLMRRGLKPLVVLLDAGSFGGLRGTEYLADRLKTIGVAVRTIANGDNLEAALSEGYREKLQAA